MIVAEQLRKTFPGRGNEKARVVAVDDVGFTAHDGQITGLLGPNGAGKTTTMRMLYTLMSPASRCSCCSTRCVGAGQRVVDALVKAAKRGVRCRVLVDGVDVARDAERVRRTLGVLPDARGVYKRLTARENIAYFGELHGMPAQAIAERTAKLAAAMQMEDFLDRATEGFSQGQRTKTAIARALVHDPKNVILDEPTNGLDVMTTRGLRGFLKDLRAEGRCVIFSSHIMQEVAALCDRIVIVSHGKVTAEGTPDELREKAGEANLEDAFVKLIGSDEGLHA